MRNEFQYLLNLNFNKEAIEGIEKLYDPCIIDNVCADDMGSFASKKLLYMRKEGFDDELILRLFFENPSIFCLCDETFIKRIEVLKSTLGSSWISIIEDDYWNNSACKYFRLCDLLVVGAFDEAIEKLKQE